MEVLFIAAMLLLLISTDFLFVLYIFYRNRGKEAKRIYESALLVCMILCLIVNVALVYSYFYPSSSVGGYEMYFENFARMFSVFNT